MLNANVYFSGSSTSIEGALSGFVGSSLGSHAFLSWLEFWMLCTIPLMFLPLLVPSQLVMVAPWFFVTILDPNPLAHSFGYQFAGAFVVPYLLLATIFALDKLHKQHFDWRGLFVGILVFSLVISPLTPLAQGRIPGIAYEPDPVGGSTHDGILNTALSLIPQNASVLTQNNLFPQVSNRADAYVYVTNNKTIFDYILVDSTSHWFNYQAIGGTQSISKWLSYFLSTGKYGYLVNDDGVILLRANYTGQILLGGGTTYTFNYKSLDLYSGSKQTDSTSTSGTILVHTSSDKGGVTFWYGPYVSLPPGRYNVTFMLRVSSTTTGSLHLEVDDFENANSIPILAESRITQANFTSLGSWTGISLDFVVTPQQTASGKLEFRGVDVVGGPFSLDYVRVTYVSAFDA
jgi:hypothetical protein